VARALQQQRRAVKSVRRSYLPRLRTGALSNHWLPRRRSENEVYLSPSPIFYIGTSPRIRGSAWFTLTDYPQPLNRFRKIYIFFLPPSCCCFFESFVYYILWFKLWGSEVSPFGIFLSGPVRVPPEYVGPRAENSFFPSHFPSTEFQRC